jgi:hypothetical protein
MNSLKAHQVMAKEENPNNESFIAMMQKSQLDNSRRNRPALHPVSDRSRSHMEDNSWHFGGGKF